MVLGKKLDIYDGLLGWLVVVKCVYSSTTTTLIPFLARKREHQRHTIKESEMIEQNIHHYRLSRKESMWRE